MAVARYLTLLWPGMPWLWLRGSFTGLILALAFALTLDVAVCTTWIWSELVDVRLSLAVWSATVAIWLAATVSAITAFPPQIRLGRDAATERLFVTARDAYLARDWLTAETKLRTALEMAPTDGEVQLLLGTLLRRAGRLDEATAALEPLARSDSGGPWQAEIARELERIAAARRPEADGGASSMAAEEAAATGPEPARRSRAA